MAIPTSSCWGERRRRVTAAPIKLLSFTKSESASREHMLAQAATSGAMAPTPGYLVQVPTSSRPCESLSPNPERARTDHYKFGNRKKSSQAVALTRSGHSLACRTRRWRRHRRRDRTRSSKRCRTPTSTSAKDWFAIELLTERDRCTGVIALRPDGEVGSPRGRRRYWRRSASVSPFQRHLYT